MTNNEINDKLLLKNYLNEIDEKYNAELYEETIDLIDKVKQISNHIYLINQKELEILEIIQNESYIRQNKFIEAFENIGSFAFLEQNQLQSSKEELKKLIINMQNRKEEL